jgi:hypothetical protein
MKATQATGMDETTFRILDTLSRELGRDISINELTSKIAAKYGSAYYANIYKKLSALNKEGIILTARTGKSSIASLNFKNYLLIDLLTEMELKKKQEFIGGKQELQMLLLEIDTYCSDLPFTKSISLINPERNAKLNRVELLIVLKSSQQESESQNTMFAMKKILSSLQSIRSIKIDYLISTKTEFLNLLRSNEINPLKEMLFDQIAFLFPQAFWIEIKSILEEGIQIRFSEEETNPAKISESDLIYNLARFGYKEIGPEIREGERICIECIIASILMKGDARRRDAIPIILVKNRANYSLLIFLAQKYGLLGKLLGLLRTLHKIKPIPEVQQAIGTLEAMNVKEVKADEKSIKSKMRLYNAIG